MTKLAYVDIVVSDTFEQDGKLFAALYVDVEQNLKGIAKGLYTYTEKISGLAGSSAEVSGRNPFPEKCVYLTMLYDAEAADDDGNPFQFADVSVRMDQNYGPVDAGRYGPYNKQCTGCSHGGGPSFLIRRLKALIRFLKKVVLRLEA